MFKKKISTEGEVVPFDLPVFQETRESQQDDTGSFNMKLEELQQQAYQKGFEAGQQAGFAMGQAKAKVLLERIETVLKEIVDIRNRLLKELKPQIVELAVCIAERILMKEIEEHPEQVVEMVKEGLMKIERHGTIIIKIHPKLKEVFEKYRPELLQMHPDIVFDVDSSLDAYEAVVTSSTAEITTNLNEQLKNVIYEMLDIAEND